MKAMVSDWRAKLASPRMFFGTVLLAPFNGPSGTGWADLRSAQLSVLALPYTGLGSAIDIGDATAPFGSYHPRRKQVPASRLVAAALDVQYGIPTPWRGPALASAAAVTDADGHVHVTLSFEPDSLGAGGLVLDYSGNNTRCPTAAGVPAIICEDFVLVADPGPGPQPPVSYNYVGGGFMAAGDDVGHCNCTLAAAQAACTANILCVGFTFMSNRSDGDDCAGGQCAVFLKGVASFVPAAGWQTFSNDRRPGGLVALNVTASVSKDRRSVILASTAPLAAGHTLESVSYAYSTWPLTPLRNLDGVPALPFFYNLSNDTSDRPNRPNALSGCSD